MRRSRLAFISQDSTWTFAKMFDEKGNLLKYKACGRGFREIQGIDYDELYSPTVKQKWSEH